uniref:Cation-independent mannose-6-phosphate receptor n=1 Tax=Strongyloides papillosus TaxID=174720 RepID=A0A0N5BYR0_STREA
MTENNNKELVEEIDDIIVNASSVSNFGDCVEKYNLHNYILKTSSNGKDCYVCILLLPRTINAVQIVYDKNNFCYNDIVHARMSCFEASLVTADMGNFLFREKDSKTVSCEINGLYDVKYHEIGSNVTCGNDKSTIIENCKNKDVLSLSFSNCSNSNFEKSYFCLGNFKDRELREYTFLFDLATGRHVCGRRISSENVVRLYVGESFHCINNINDKNIIEYIFTKKNYFSDGAHCIFPQYLRGSYENFDIEDNKLIYKKGIDNLDNLSSFCISNSSNTFLVKTYAECGVPLAYNCFHFVVRSPAVVQIKIRGAQTNSIEECLSYPDNDDSFWVTASKNYSFKSSCGFEGSWSTIFDHTSDRCFNVDVTSPTFSSFNIVGYNCQDNSIFQTSHYQCMGTWKENNKIYLYTRENTNDTTRTNSNICFIIQNIGSKVLLTKVGSQCLQSYSVNQTLTLEQKLVEPSLISTPLIEMLENDDNSPQGNMNDLIEEEFNENKILTQDDDHSVHKNITKTINSSSKIFFLTNTFMYIFIFYKIL